ncbi:YdcF family protein [Ampullimonas aquatilis]|uniref:YdcF family protein n=1 Tax=Ampullimonas aquatilis TaxID=1341549 RepID=UPI003C774D9B
MLAIFQRTILLSFLTIYSCVSGAVESFTASASASSGWQPGIGRVLVQIILLPPTAWLFWLLIGALLRWLGQRRAAVRLKRLGTIVLVLTLVLTYLGSTKFFAYRAMAALEEGPWLDLQTPLAGQTDTPPQAIVVLGAGRSRTPTEYGATNIRFFTLERVRFAARLYHATHLPVLVSGGNPELPGASEAELMKQVLELELATPVNWMEGASNTSADNAAFSAALLKQAGIGRVFLVTHGWHMRRAKQEFEQAGLTVLPAPCGRTGYDGVYLADFIPHPEAILASQIVVREAIGLFWYFLAPNLGLSKT